MSAAPLAAEIKSDRAWRPSHNPWLVAMTVTLATFMEVLDSSIANVALPHIAGGLSAGVDESTWILTSYLVSNAIVLPISGWLAGIFGRKRFYMACVTIFTLSSFLCGLAPSLAILVVLRVVQGAGGGGLQPSEQAILADTFAPEEFGMAFAVYGMAVVLAPAIGPTLGGWITDNFTWRWIFFINVPVGLISLLLSYRMVEDPPYVIREVKERKGGIRIDYIGLGLIAVGLGMLQIVLDKGQRLDWFQSHFIAIFTIVGTLAVSAFILWELRAEHPVIDLRLFKNRTFAISATMMFTLGIVLFGTTVLLPQYVQELMGYTAEQAGMVLTPGGFVMMVTMPIVGALISRVDAMAYRDRVCGHRACDAAHDGDLSGGRFPHRDALPHLSVDGACVPVHPDHDDGVFRDAPGPEQRYFVDHEFLAQRRRQYRHLDGYDDARAALAVSSDRADDPGDAVRRDPALATDRTGASAISVRRRQYQPSRARGDLRADRADGQRAGVYRRDLADGDCDSLYAAAGPADAQKRARRRVSRSALTAS